MSENYLVAAVGAGMRRVGAWSKWMYTAAVSIVFLKGPVCVVT